MLVRRENTFSDLENHVSLFSDSSYSKSVFLRSCKMYFSDIVIVLLNVILFDAAEGMGR